MHPLGRIGEVSDVASMIAIAYPSTPRTAG